MTAVNWSNFTDFAQLPGLANTASNGTFWVGILHMVWLVLLLLMISYGFEIALLVASFLALIIAFLLAYSDVLNWIYVMEFSGIILAMFLYIIWSGRKQ